MEHRKQELQARIWELTAQEQAKGQKLLALAGEVGQTAARFDSAQQATHYRDAATKEAVMAKRQIHIDRLKAEAELAAFLMAEAQDDPLLAEDRSELERIDAEIEALKAKREGVQARIWEREGVFKRHQTDHWRLIAEANQFEAGSAAM